MNSQSMEAEILVKESMDSAVDYIIQVDKNIFKLYELIDNNQVETAIDSIEALLEGMDWICSLSKYMSEFIESSLNTTHLENQISKIEMLISEKKLVEIKKIIEDTIMLELKNTKSIIDSYIQERLS